MSSPNSLTVESGSNERWKFFRDVLVFQLKMLLDNVRDFALMPVSLVAALIDLIFKGKRHGSLFYQVLRWGAHSEKVINVYSAIEEHERPKVNPSYTVDAVIARLEGVTPQMERWRSYLKRFKNTRELVTQIDQALPRPNAR
jgi:hypothetical protein